MRIYMLDLLVCPKCDHFPLDVDSSQLVDANLNMKIEQPCTIYCAYNKTYLSEMQTNPECNRCTRLQIHEGEIICPNCHSIYHIRDRIVDFSTEETNQDWIASEKSWWDNRYSQISNISLPDTKSPANNPAINLLGDRMYERNKHIFQPLIDDGINGCLALEIGCGTSEYIARLMPPDLHDFFYIGTDIAIKGLRKAADMIPAGDFILCSAGKLPLRNQTLDVLLSLGVLHHIPEWQNSLGKMLTLLKPGGRFAFNEAIDKPRVFGTFRRDSLTANIDSPHEGEVDKDTLLSLLNKHGTMMNYQVESTPLRVILIWLTRSWVRQSVSLTKLILILDKVFLNTFGKIIPSLGAGEIIGICRNQ